MKENPETKDAVDAAKDLDTKIDVIQSGTRTSPGIGPVNRDYRLDDFMIETGDAAPSDSAEAAIHESCSALTSNLAAWRQLKTQSVPPLNALLEKYKLAPLATAASTSSSGGSADASSAHAPLAPSPAGDSSTEASAPLADPCSP